MRVRHFEGTDWVLGLLATGWLAIGCGDADDLSRVTDSSGLGGAKNDPSALPIGGVLLGGGTFTEYPETANGDGGSALAEGGTTGWGGFPGRGGTLGSGGYVGWSGASGPGGATDRGGAGSSCPSNGHCPNGVRGDGTLPAEKCPSDGGDHLKCGCNTVSGLGINKVDLLDAGGGLDMMATAMMQTQMMDTDYPLGDDQTMDAFRVGVCKQNWGMIRECHPAWNGLGPDDYPTATALNGDRRLDVSVYYECLAWFGDAWLAGYRNGIEALEDPETPDVRRFRIASQWTARMLEEHTCDDVRFWVELPPGAPP